MARQTKDYCWFCEQDIWTVNNNIEIHHKHCNMNPANCHKYNSSVTKNEIESLIIKSKEFRESNDQENKDTKLPMSRRYGYRAVIGFKLPNR